MCGIVGYVGTKKAAPLLLDALEKLEYRGYDSAGLAIIENGKITVKKTKGRLLKLREATDNGASIDGCVGLGHTRWATHGEPSELNSHPHLSGSKRIAVVHNGIIENYVELREFLIGKGYKFLSDTDTEVISHLIDYYYSGDPVHAVREATEDLEGSYALGILFLDRPDQLIAVRKDSPLIIGKCNGENFIASDIPAILKHTNTIYRLDEHELAIITKDSITITNKLGTIVERQPETIEWSTEAAEKGGYEHFMIKEIMEQPETVRATLSSYTKNGKVAFELNNITDDDFKNVKNIVIVACGSAYHAGYVAKMLFEKYARIPTQAYLGSEYRYLDPIMPDNTLTIVISQSGETIDTLYAMREARSLGSKSIAIVNVVGSTIASESDDVIYTRAGPEIAVATTKAYTAQLAVAYLLTAHIMDCKGIAHTDGAPCVSDLEKLPALLETTLAVKEQSQYLSSLYFNCDDVFFLGRNIDYALALEASLKLKEISYIHSEAYAAGELKHGTISLIEEGTLVVALCTYEPLFPKIKSNIEEVKTRGAKVIAIVNEGTTLDSSIADHVITLPKCPAFMCPSLAILPLQLFAYYIASHRGCDIDKPRNLAKSVTVE